MESKFERCPGERIGPVGVVSRSKVPDDIYHIRTSSQARIVTVRKAQFS